MDHPAMVEAFTITEAAEALGRTPLTLKRWIEEDMVPQPVLRDTVRGYRHYSLGELQLIANHLAQHEREFSYYAKAHEETQHRLHQAMQGYRARHI